MWVVICLFCFNISSLLRKKKNLLSSLVCFAVKYFLENIFRFAGVCFAVKCRSNYNWFPLTGKSCIKIRKTVYAQKICKPFSKICSLSPSPFLLSLSLSCTLHSTIPPPSLAPILNSTHLPSRRSCTAAPRLRGSLSSSGDPPVFVGIWVGLSAWQWWVAGLILGWVAVVGSGDSYFWWILVVLGVGFFCCFVLRCSKYTI